MYPSFKFRSDIFLKRFYSFAQLSSLLISFKKKFMNLKPSRIYDKMIFIYVYIHSLINFSKKNDNENVPYRLCKNTSIFVK